MRTDLAGVAASTAFLLIGGCSTLVAPWNADSAAADGVSHHVTVIHDAAVFGEGGWLLNGEMTKDAHWLTLHPTGSSPEQMAAFESPVLRSPIRFDEALLSWNVDVPEGCGVRFDLRVADSHTGEWSPWMYVGRWGTFPAGERVQESEFGRMDVDYFRSDRLFDRAQYRVIAARAEPDAIEEAPASGAESEAVRVRRLALTFSDRAPLPEAHPRNIERATPAGASAGGAEQEAAEPVAMDVPFRSQKSERREIAGRICSPTSVTMVMAYRGVVEPVEVVAARALDEDTGIYGNWPANVQAAYTFGVPGYLTRVNDWAQARRLLEKGQPLIVSIQAERGELEAAPYRGTDGHLLVIRGLDENGDVLVNDPAARTPEAGVTTYRREDMERVWLQRGAGTAYVLLPVE